MCKKNQRKYTNIQLNGLEPEQLWEIVKDRGDVCCSPWGHKELDTT